MKWVAATCSAHFSQSAGTALVGFDQGDLQEGLLISPAMVTVKKGTVHIPAVNVGQNAVALYPHPPIAVLSQADVVRMPEGVSFTRQKLQGVGATIHSQTATSNTFGGADRIPGPLLAIGV